MEGLIYAVLKAIGENGVLTPGDAVRVVSAPRYRVLAAFQVLEELGLAETIYSRGSHKVFALTSLGRKVLLAVENGLTIRGLLEEGVERASPTLSEASSADQVISSGT
ncbi:hypothetical protein apy_01470 [Aeropyrum pernix]|uniref:ArnR1-like winged helix-turn-helix domain-containing protein n=1 Tax=Aeropyrum pernix TaxID=56636 RepID=A0A401H7W0_AERPX|nr:hypothetical protein [Aeropyrum pernix]GBF08422.1 hypothetical protein apy_01470 [Aeropyrum pernix]